MSSEDTGLHSSDDTRSYLIMKADAEEALGLAAEWWESKEVPNYIHIRNLQKNEMEEFVDLYNRCFMASPDPFCPLTFEEANKLETDGIFVAELWHTLAGFIACFVEKDGDSVYGEITGIGVLPSRRRKGVATALIQRASEYFLNAGVEEVYCEVYEENRPSQMLIRTYGFKEAGRREIPMNPMDRNEDSGEMPGGKIMRRMGLRPRKGCETCRDI